MDNPDYLDILNQQQQDERKQAQWGHTFSPWIPQEKINLPAYKSPLKLNFQNPFSEFDNKRISNFNKVLNSDYSSLAKGEKKLNLPTIEDYFKSHPIATSGTTQSISAFQKGWQKVNKFMNSKGAQIGMQALDFSMNFLGDNDKDINPWDASVKQFRRGIEEMLPLEYRLAAKFIDMTGGFSDSTKGLGTGRDIGNTILSFVPGLGWASGKSREIQKDKAVQASSGYTGVANDVNKAAQNAGGRFLLGMDTANHNTIKADLAQTGASEILDYNKIAKQGSNHPLRQMGTQIQTSGGFNLTASAKMGAKLYNIEEAKRILNNRLQSFKNGGAVNVIPDGALHKNRHHLEDIDEKFEDVTTKGIPVITEAKNGDIIQQAEVEKEEIIFNLAVTKKLEELMEKDTDEAAIEAGKLLTEEILRNTIDNTNKLL